MSQPIQSDEVIAVNVAERTGRQTQETRRAQDARKMASEGAGGGIVSF